MANAKISALPVASALALTDLFAIADGTNTSKSATIQDIGVLIGGGRGALVFLSTDVAAANNSTTTLGWDSEDYDTDNIHDNSTNNQRLTVPSGVTKVRFTTSIGWAANATGEREIFLFKNGSEAFVGNSSDTRNTTSNLATHQTATAIIEVVAGDFFTAGVFQNSGGSLDVLSGNGVVVTWAFLEIIE